MNSIQAVGAARDHKQAALDIQAESDRLWRNANRLQSLSGDPKAARIYSNLIATADRLRKFHVDRAEALMEAAGNAGKMRRH